MRHYFAAAIVLFGVLVLPLFAEEGKGPPKGPGDGQGKGPGGPGGDMARNPEEFKRRLLEKFDANRDGVLSEQEQMQAQELMRRQGITLPGMAPGGFPGGPEFLKKFDTNGDGQLSDQEKFAAQAAFQKSRGEGGGPAVGREGAGRPNGGDGGSNGGVEGKPAPDKRSALVKRFDTDGDGKLNDEEKAAAQAELKNAKGAKKAKPREKSEKTEK